MEKKNIKAVIMAGGIGSRLKPITDDMPKPLAPICNIPCIEHIISLLKHHNITDIAVSLAYKGDMIKEDLKHMEGVNLHFFDEEKPMGTAGSVKNCSKFLDSDFMVISGDALCDFNLSEAVDFHFSHGGISTIVFTRVKNPLEYGVAVIDDDDKVVRFIEKPSWNRVYSDTANTGIYIFSNEIFEHIDMSEGKSDFSKDVFPELLKHNIPIHGKVMDGYWCDIGNSDAFLQSNMDMLTGKIKIDSQIKHADNITGVTIFQPCVVGKNVKIGKGSIIGPNIIISDNCTIGEDSRIEHSVIMDDCILGKNVSIRHSTICRNTRIDNYSSVGELSVIGNGCEIGENTVISAHTRIHSGNKIPNDNFVSGNVFSYMKDLALEDGKIVTESNGFEDVSKYVKIGAAFGSIFQGDIVVGYGESDALAITMASNSGLISVGCGIFDIGVCNKNALRYVVRRYGFKGGIFFCKEDNKITVTFFLSDGLTMNREAEREFEKVYSLEEFKSGKGFLRQFNGFSIMYRRHIRSIMGKMKPIKAVLIAPSVIADSIVVRSSTNLERIYVSEDEIYIEKAPNKEGEREAYSSDQIKAALTYVYGTTFGKVYIPYSFPFICEEIAEKNGFSLERLTLEDENRHLLYDMTNTDVTASVLLRYMSNYQCSFADIVDKIPQFATASRTISTTREKAEIMHELTANENNLKEKSTKEFIEGVKVYLPSKHGSILIVPEKNMNRFRIYAEAMQSETAEEICDFYVKKIKNNKTDVEKDT